MWISAWVDMVVLAADEYEVSGSTLSEGDSGSGAVETRVGGVGMVS